MGFYGKCLTTIVFERFDIKVIYVEHFQGMIVCNFHVLLAMRMCGKEEKLKRQVYIN